MTFYGSEVKRIALLPVKVNSAAGIDDAVGGAITANASGNAAVGDAIDGAAGAVAGGLIGRNKEKKE
jgi:outer membrane lipoprotein SlyB